MPLYAYKGIGKNGKAVDGVRDAESPKSLRQAMRRDGVVVTDVSLSKGKRAVDGGSGLNKDVHLGDIFGRVKKTEVAAFTRQLATLLRAGIPLAESLGALFEQTENVRFKVMVEEVKSAVNEGSSLADAVGKHPDAFDDLFVSMVRAGEQAGNLDEVLSRLADFMESAAQLRSKVQGAMIYPALMVVVSVGIMMFLMVVVVPNITNMFEAQGAALPLPTRILIWVSDTAASFWFVFVGLVIAGGFAFRSWSQSESGKPQWHAFVLSLPLIGPLVRQVAVARFARTVGTMLNAGVPMLQVLDTAKAILGNVVLIRVIDDAKVAVTEGESLAVSLRKSGHFPAAMTHMIAVGERSGALEQMLLRVADAFERDVDTKLGRVTSLLGPLILVFMGVAVAFIVVAILLPMMNMQKLTQY